MVSDYSSFAVTKNFYYSVSWTFGLTSVPEEEDLGSQNLPPGQVPHLPRSEFLTNFHQKVFLQKKSLPHEGLGSHDYSTCRAPPQYVVTSLLFLLAEHPHLRLDSTDFPQQLLLQ
jgi:hypothetical protein